jgi:hypothetical protein
MTAIFEALRQSCRDHGVFLRAEALALGVDDGALRRSVKSGYLVRVRHGAYTFSDLWHGTDDRGRHLILVRAVMRLSLDRAAVSHHSAALLHGMDLWKVPLTKAHLTRLDEGAGRIRADVVHHEGRAAADDLTVRDGLTATRAVRAALESATLLDVEHGLCVVDSGLRSGLFDHEELTLQADRMHSWPNSQHLQVVTRLADARSESVGESRSKHLFWSCGLPAPRLQYEVYDRGVLVATTDFAWPELGLLGEFDGKVKYTRYLRPGETPGDAVFREKQREDLLRRLTGWGMFRLTWSMLYDRAGTMQAFRSSIRIAA